ncbi:hypothetical protein F2Q70_00033923 [Brassica cretica]|uniref:Aldehyde oxidase/xanthine dehydrogenase a/b hammerhead domain-containing protein n=1 Tax=Brassica cretica TaxID=69181 RepID=A0A8S9JY58_BRACR|nr:hypothetical protein F2Q70_00033923 [Brassica cretica]
MGSLKNDGELNEAILYVNGVRRVLPDGLAHVTLLEYLRVLSKVPHARILSIDDSAAKSSLGFVGLFLAKDIPGDNMIGPIVADEELFATDVVTCVGQVIGVVVADTHENAKTAAGKVEVLYEKLPAILSIKEAVNAKSFHPNTEKRLRKGDVELCFQSGECDRIIEGEVQIGGQEHFYLEPHGSLVWTLDGGNEVHMISSTQAPQKHQKYVSHVLGLPMCKVVCKTKRIGGGFGGKILALDLEIYNNGGNSLDLSLAILERAMFHSDNVYEIPHVRIVGNVCFTNFPSNTAFRGFGGPQGMLITENWIQRIAAELDKTPEEIKVS